MRFAVLRALYRAPKRARWNETKRCYWCNRSVAYFYNGGQLRRSARATREHIIPKSLGGGDGGNRVVACHRCNQARGRDLSWVPFKRLPSLIRKYAPLQRDGDGYVEALTGRRID